MQLSESDSHFCPLNERLPFAMLKYAAIIFALIGMLSLEQIPLWLVGRPFGFPENRKVLRPHTNQESALESSFTSVALADEEESAAFFIRNPSYEQVPDHLAPWSKAPAAAPGTIGFECNTGKNTTPGGNCNGVLEPKEANVVMFQTVQVVAGTSYEMQVRVSTNGGVTAKLYYKINGQDTLCGQTSVQFPDYEILQCSSVIPPAGTTKVRVKIEAVAAPLGKKVYVDDWVWTPQPYRYAYASKHGNIQGVDAFIDAHDAGLREYYHSYSTINLLDDDGEGVEIGILKSPDTNCVPKFSWGFSGENVPDPFKPNYVGVPTDLTYEFAIRRIGFEQWRLRIWKENGDLVWSNVINIPGLDSGTVISAGGEVFSPRKQNDMGVSWLQHLKYRAPGTNWVDWNGFQLWTDGAPEYSIGALAHDPLNAVQIQGNNGNPVIPGSPCP